MNIDEIPIGQAKDLRGQKFGKLTVLYRVKAPDDKIIYKKSYWKCICDCGNECVLSAERLHKNKWCSCGQCEIIAPQTKNLVGQRFGRLTVISPTKKRASNNGVIWHCLCDCGNYYDVPGSRLLCGQTKSCGCLTPALDITGKRFGKLVAIKPTEKHSNSSILWECQCDCGNIHYASVSDLNMGYVQSCGCLTCSKGELKIRQLLQINNISYKTEVKFNNLKQKNYLRFDFGIYNTKNELIYLIEYDGIQHFKEGYGWNNKYHVQQTQENDKLKNQWCKDNNIPLIRIPYLHFKNLCIEDLLLETSQFIIK